MNAAVINKNAKLQRVPEACADTNWSKGGFWWGNKLKSL